MRLPTPITSLCLAFISIAPFALPAAPTSTWVHAGTDGRLDYKTDERGNRIPDFSNVGYHGGAVAFPDVVVKATVEPGGGDDGKRIQAAIDEVSKLPADANGHRGAVLLKKGRYPIAGAIHLHTSGVVLRGEGQGPEDTVLIATGNKQRSLIVAGGKPGAKPSGDDDEAPHPDAKKVRVKALCAITDDYVPVGARSFHVDEPAGLQVGQEIVVRRPSTEAWIHDIGMDRIPPADHQVVQWQPGSKDLLFNRTITALDGDRVTIDAPLMNALEKKYGGGDVRSATDDDTLREIGVENLRGDSEFATPTDEKHGWVLVDFSSVRDGWVCEVTSVHFGYSCVYVQRASRSVTVRHCTCLDPVSQITGGRRYSFALDSQLTLVEHCYARGGRHDFVMHALAAGPNVFFDCLAEDAHADSGPHHRWSAGVLYDNVRIVPPKGDSKKGDGALNIRNRGNLGTGHGWAGANQVAWNSQARDMMIEQPPTAQNWAIGCKAESHSGNGYWDSFGTPVEPKSLYVAQLRERTSQAGGGTAKPAP